jgi:hypothetical protein
MEKKVEYLKARVTALETALQELQEENAELLNDLIKAKTNERND